MVKFYDLNIPRPFSAKHTSAFEEILASLLKRGYKAVAITTEMEDSVFEKNKKDKNKTDKNDVIPLPFNTKTLKEKFPELTIYSRLDIVLSKSENIQKINQSSNAKLYNLIAVIPHNTNVLKSLTGTSEIDIIAFKPETRSEINFTRKLYKQFVNNNVFFELVYGPAVIDSTARKNLISLAHTYHRIGKSKNIIVSSGISAHHLTRGPYDVMNLGLIFGLSEDQTKDALTRNCMRLILHARKQRMGKCSIEIKPKEN